MKKYTSIALIGVLVVGMAGFISLDAISATSFATMKVASDVHETSKMIGHVTYELRGADGNIKHYVQSDNVIVQDGTDCAATSIFDTANVDLACSLSGEGGFAFIAIGNATIASGASADADDSALDISGTGSAGFGTGSGLDPKTEGDEMGRSDFINADISLASTSPTGVTTVSIASGPFAFDKVNLDVGPRGTVITQSGLFDSAAGGNMFSIRDIPPDGTGLTVTEADTLSVTWTITLGQ
jgi:hypothetical protein